MGPQRVGRTEAGSVASSYSLRATVVITTATTAKGSLATGLMRSVCRHPALRDPPSFQPRRGQNEGPGCPGCRAALLLPPHSTPALPCPVWAEAVRAEVSLRGGGLSQM